MGGIDLRSRGEGGMGGVGRMGRRFLSTVPSALPPFLDPRVGNGLPPRQLRPMNAPTSWLLSRSVPVDVRLVAATLLGSFALGYYIN